MDAMQKRKVAVVQKISQKCTCATSLSTYLNLQTQRKQREIGRTHGHVNYRRTFHRCIFHRYTFHRCIFHRCIFHRCTFHRCTFHRCTFHRCIYIAIKLSYTVTTGATAQESVVEVTSFSQSLSIGILQLTKHEFLPRSFCDRLNLTG